MTLFPLVPWQLNRSFCENRSHFRSQPYSRSLKRHESTKLKSVQGTMLKDLQTKACFIQILIFNQTFGDIIELCILSETAELDLYSATQLVKNRFAFLLAVYMIMNS